MVRFCRQLTMITLPEPKPQSWERVTTTSIERGHALIRNLSHRLLPLTAQVRLTLQLAVAWPQLARTISPFAAVIDAQHLSTLALRSFHALDGPIYPLICNKTAPNEYLG